MTSARPRDSAQVEQVVRGFFGLEPADQLRAFTSIREYLSEGVVARDQVEVEIAARARVMAAMRTVADHVGWERGQPFGIKEYERVRRLLGLDVSRRRVLTVWGTWSHAKNALAGEWVRETPAQRARRKKVWGTSRARMDYFTWVARWLDDGPPAETMVEYSAWARENGSDTASAPSGEAIKATTSLPWDRVVSVARGDMTDRKARKEELKERRLAAGPLAGLPDIALTGAWGSSQAQYETKKPGFPSPVAVGNNRAAIWLWKEVDRWFAGKLFEPNLDRLDGQRWVFAAEMRTRLGYKPEIANSLIHQRSQHLIPAPDGNVGGTRYWRRDRFDAWFEADADERKILGAPDKENAWARKTWEKPR